MVVHIIRRLRKYDVCGSANVLKSHLGGKAISGTEGTLRQTRSIRVSLLKTSSLHPTPGGSKGYEWSYRASILGCGNQKSSLSGHVIRMVSFIIRLLLQYRVDVRFYFTSRLARHDVCGVPFACVCGVQKQNRTCWAAGRSGRCTLLTLL